MESYKISYNGDTQIKNIHHIGVDYNGNYYSVIFGEYVNGGGELADFSDVFWNTESIQKSLKSKRAAKAIAKVIADYTRE